MKRINNSDGSIVEDDKIDRCAGMEKGKKRCSAWNCERGDEKSALACRQASRREDRKRKRKKEKVRKEEEESWTIQNIRNMQRYGNMLWLKHFTNTWYEQFIPIQTQ